MNTNNYNKTIGEYQGPVGATQGLHSSREKDLKYNQKINHHTRGNTKQEKYEVLGYH